MRFSLNFKSLVLRSLIGLLAMAPVYAGNINVEYNQQQDKIAIQATNASLTSVLAEIANKTNMTIQIDPAVEKQVSFQLRPQPLQQALQKVVKGLSYVIEYKIDGQQQTVVSGLRLLPKGKQDSGQLVSVAVLNARASQNSSRMDRDDSRSINRRGNYYPGVGQSRAIRQPKQSASSRQKTPAPDDMVAEDVDTNTVTQYPKTVPKQTRPDVPSADVY